MTENGITQTLASSIGYQPFGPRSAMTLGNGIAVNAEYDADYRLKRKTQGAVFDRSYAYDATDNMISVTNHIDPATAFNLPILNETYQYLTDAHHLNSISGTTPRVYQYDAAEIRGTKFGGHNTH